MTNLLSVVNCLLQSSMSADGMVVLIICVRLGQVAHKAGDCCPPRTDVDVVTLHQHGARSNSIMIWSACPALLGGLMWDAILARLGLTCNFCY